MPSRDETRREQLRQGVIGLGEHSARKSYYPELRRRLEELERAQEELTAYRDDLERQVAARTEELRRSNEELREATRTKDQFLANMSHELRTPLNSIIGFTDLLRRGLTGPVTDEQVQQLDLVYNAGRHLLGLISDILDLAKIESGEMVPTYEPFEVRDVVDEAAGIVAPQAREKGLALLLEISDVPDTIVSDRQRFLQILLNLLGNAVKFTNDGSVTVTVSCPADELILEVHDTGPGIHPVFQADVWKPFHQVRPERGGKPVGTGLGLSITRELVTMLGGSVSLRSSPGEGSTFVVRLPCTPAEQPREDQS